MGVPGNANALLLVQAAAAGGYTIDRSLRFNSADSAYLSRTPASAGNRKTFTISFWLKRTNLGVNYQSVFGAGASGGNGDLISFANNDTLRFWVNGGTDANIVTTQVFRDASAWYHILYAVDTTQATSSNRIKLYVNGLQVTALTATYPTQNYDFGSLNTATAHEIGRGYSAQLDGYLADVHFIDGQALDPTSFGEFDTNGVWQPLAYGGSYGTNGFHLDFADNSSAAALGNDTSGNNNDWTVNNISAATGGPTSVAAASGALPIYNTTDTYGTTKGTGTRTDTNSSSIVLAVPMDGANNGTTFTDESATIKGSGSAKTPTVNGNTKTSTALSKYYGSSGLFDGTGDCLTYASSSDFQIWSGAFTVECWFYLNSLVDSRGIFGFGNRASTTTRCFLITRSSGNLQFDWDGWSADGSLSVSAGLSAGKWYHCAVVSTGSTVTIYVNGTALGSSSIGSSSQSNAPLSIGAQGASANPATNDGINGYLQDFRVYKGVAKYTGNFNPPDATQNSAIAPGCDSLRDSPTNGDTADDTGLGNQVAGNYCTWNPLIYRYSAADKAELSNGNLDALFDATAHGQFVYGTISVSTGKWYFEYLINNTGGGGAGVGVANYGHANNNYSLSRIYQYSGNKYDGTTSTSYGASYANGDIVGVALDMDNGTLVFYKNGSSQGTAFSDLLTLSSVTVHGSGDNNSSFTLNAGQRPFAYTAPSGFKALCTTNLPTPTIADGSTAMDVKLYTGNGSSQSISGLGFSPDLVWIKQRSSDRDHCLCDIVRGTSKRLRSNTTDAETTESVVTAFNSTGFTIGSDNGVNQSSGTYVAWTWDAGSSTVTNTSGSISSQVRANASAGFSIVTYTGTGSAATVGHGLNAAVQFLIVKRRDLADRYWMVYHVSTGNTNRLVLNDTVSVSASSAYWNNTTPTSTVFSLGADPGNFSNSTNASNGNYVAYCFAPVAGYSAFGSYTGNGSADGPFVYTGHKVKWLMVKRTDSAEPWWMWDVPRSTAAPGNPMNALLRANGSDQEYAPDTAVDSLSNGFKPRSSSANVNASGGTYIYMSFASHPFQTARAR